MLHLVWADNTNGDADIFYAATTDGLPATALTGASIVDDTSNADQVAPAVAVSGTGDSLKVFACWQDARQIRSRVNPN